jgi:hypothetical protein
MAIDSLTLEQYHKICFCYLSKWRNITVSTDVTVNVGVIIACSSSDQLEHAVEIVSLPDVEVECGDWGRAAGEVMADGWTR